MHEDASREWFRGPGWWLPFPTIGPPPSVVRLAWGATKESVVQWLIFSLIVGTFVVSGAALWAYCLVPVALVQVTRDDTAAVPRGWRRYLSIPLWLRLGPRAALNALSAILLGSISAWAVANNSWRLVVLLLGVAFLCTKTSGRLSFTLWSLADDRPVRNLVSSGALFYGPFLIIIMCMLSYAGPRWPADNNWLPVAVAVSGALTSWHVAQSKFAFFAAEHRARSGRREGQREVMATIHSRISQDLRFATRLASRDQQQVPELLQCLVMARVRLDVLEAKVNGLINDAGEAEILQEIVWTTADLNGADAFADIAIQPLHPDDFDLAQLVLHDLTANAVEAGTPILEVTVTAIGALEIFVDDRAGGIPPERWRAPGSSLQLTRRTDRSARWHPHPHGFQRRNPSPGPLARQASCSTQP